MTKRFFTKMAPVFLGVFAASAYVGCGGEQVGQVEQQVETATVAATINQTDLNNFTTAVNLKGCTFVVASGVGTFTPSNQLSQALYGDPNGKDHVQTVTIPTISTSDATVTITSLNAEMANTKFTLSGSNLDVHLAVDGLIHASITSPVKVTTDVQVNSSSVDVNLTYNATTQLYSVSSVTSNFSTKAKNCGGTGWCNSIVNSLLSSKLPGMVNSALQDALGKALNSASATTDLDDLLVVIYNQKNPKTPPWTMVANTLTLAGGQFSFTAQ